MNTKRGKILNLFLYTFKSICFGMLILLISACESNVKFALPESVDKFDSEITYNNKVDVVWLVDNSSSMQKHQESLSSQVPAMVEKMNSLKLDYNMVVITTDMRSGGSGGKFLGQPKVLNKNTLDLAQKISSRIVQGQTGSSLERGFESLQRVLERGHLENEGVGFLRQDALLVINVLSDEDDNSASTTSQVYDFLNNLKGVERDRVGGWTMNFIGVLSNSTECKTFNDYSEPGTKYMELADLSGGRKESICTSNLTQAVSNIGVRIVRILTDYKLSKRPNVSTIVVRIDGSIIPQNSENGWSYIQELNVIRFNGASIPNSDQKIFVDFIPEGAN